MSSLPSPSRSDPQNGDCSAHSDSTFAVANETDTLVPWEPEESRHYCGCGPFRPRVLQWFARPTVYTILLCLFVLVESCVVSGLSFVAISTVEERYHISSTAMGVVISMFDASIIACVLFVSYFGGHGYRARWLAVGEVVMGIGCLIFATPQFLFNNYKPAENETEALSYELCSDVDSNTSDSSSFHAWAYTFFFVGQLVIGAGTSPLYTVGISYLDELVLPKYLSIHLSVVYMVSTFGPALGFGLGGAFLSIYIDPWKDPGIGPSDTGWLGAWWLGFVIFGLLSLLLSAFFFLFPRTLESEKEVREARLSEHAKKGGSLSSEDRKSFFQFLCVFLRQLKRLLTSVNFLFLIAAVSTLNLAVGVIVPFAPKYMEKEFYVSSSTAGLLVGVCAIIGAGLGVILGGAVMYFFKNPQTKAKRMALFLCVVSGLALPFLLSYLIHCPSVDVVGIGNGSSVVNTFDCNVDCGCTSSHYWPVCGSDGLTYSSPCYAGCTQDSNSGMDASFANCSCIGEQTNASLPAAYGTAEGGICDTGCRLVGVFLFVLSIAVLLEFMRVVPFVFLTLRSVRDDERPLSLGVTSALGRLLGTIPGPILGGLVFDSTCLLWQEEDGIQGNCWIHDNDALYVRNMILVMLALTLSFLTTVGVYVTYPKNVASSQYQQPDIDGDSLKEILPPADLEKD